MTPSSDRLEQGRANLLRVGGRNEFLCVDVPFEQAPLHKRGDTRLDHQRRTTKIGFVTSEIATEVAVRHLMDEAARSEEHTSELQSLMRISYAVFCLKKKIDQSPNHHQKINTR